MLRKRTESRNWDAIAKLTAADNVKIIAIIFVLQSHPPHFSPRAIRADFSLSRPREANSCEEKTAHMGKKIKILSNIQLWALWLCFSSLPPKRRMQRGPDELQHVSKRCSSLSTSTQQKCQRATQTRTTSTHFSPTSRTYRPAREVPILPFLLKVWQHFAVEIILVQQRLDPVCVVLQVLQQHLQVPAQPHVGTNFSNWHLQRVQKSVMFAV